MRLAIVCPIIVALISCTACSPKPNSSPRSNDSAKANNAAQPSEIIEEFNVKLSVRADGTVVAEEEIKVQVHGKKIKRGSIEKS